MYSECHFLALFFCILHSWPERGDPFAFKGNFMFTFPLQGLAEEDKKTVPWYFWQLMGKKCLLLYISRQVI